jgi:hypothetical protein
MLTGTASNFEFVANDGTVSAVDGTLAAGSTAAFIVNVTPAQTFGRVFSPGAANRSGDYRLSLDADRIG